MAHYFPIAARDRTKCPVRSCNGEDSALFPDRVLRGHPDVTSCLNIPIVLGFLVSAYFFVFPHELFFSRAKSQRTSDSIVITLRKSFRACNMYPRKRTYSVTKGEGGGHSAKTINKS